MVDSNRSPKNLFRQKRVTDFAPFISSNFIITKLKPGIDDNKSPEGVKLKPGRDDNKSPEGVNEWMGMEI